MQILFLINKGKILNSFNYSLCLSLRKGRKEERSSERTFFFLLGKHYVFKHSNFERKEGTENCWDKEKNHTLCELCKKWIYALNVFVINSAALQVDESLGWTLPKKFWCGKIALENSMCIWPIMNVLLFLLAKQSLGLQGLLCSCRYLYIFICVHGPIKVKALFSFRKATEMRDVTP